MTSTGKFIKPNGFINQNLKSTDGEEGIWLSLTTLEFFIFSLKSLPVLRKLTKALSLPSAHHSKAGTRDSFESLVVQIETHCIPKAKEKANKLSLGGKNELRITAVKLEPNFFAILEGSWQDHSVWTYLCQKIIVSEHKIIHLHPALCICPTSGFIYCLWLHTPRILQTHNASCLTGFHESGEGLPAYNQSSSFSSSLRHSLSRVFKY